MALLGLLISLAGLGINGFKAIQEHADREARLGIQLGEEIDSAYRALNPTSDGMLETTSKTAHEIRVAEEHLARAERLAPGDDRIAHLRVAILVAKGKWAEATVALRRHLEHHPEDKEAHAELGGVLYEQGELDEAEKELKAIANSAVVQLNLGLIQQKRGNVKEALKLYEDAIRSEPTLINAYLAKCQGHIDLEEHDEALAACEQGITISAGKDGRLYLALSQAYSLRNALDRAERAARLAKDLLPTDPYVRDALGKILYYRGKRKEAISEFETATFLEAHSTRFKYHLIWARAGLKRLPDQDFRLIVTGIRPCDAKDKSCRRER